MAPVGVRPPQRQRMAATDGRGARVRVKSPETIAQAAVEAMVEQHQLRRPRTTARPTCRRGLRPREQIAGVRVTVDVTADEDHTAEGGGEQVRELGAAEARGGEPLLVGQLDPLRQERGVASTPRGA